MTVAAFRRVAKALAAMTAEQRLDVAFQSAVPARMVHRAAKTAGRVNVRPFDGAAYVQICSTLRLDPLTGEITEKTAGYGLFLPEHLACAVKMSRFDAALSQRAAARKWHIEPTALCRIENAIAVSVDPLIGICKALKRHPFDFLSPKRFHGEHKVQHVEKTTERVGA